MTQLQKFNLIALTLFYLGHSNAQCTRTITDPDQSTTITYECPEDILYLTASISYNNQYATGRAFTKFGAGNNGHYHKPLILVEGLDLDLNQNHDQGDRFGDRGWPNFITGASNERDPSDHILDKLPVLISDLHSRGYDMIYLDFANGSTYMQANAMVLIELIQYLNGHKTGNEPIMVVGASMGGQISKYALSYMEQHNMKHCVNEYMTFDSPHQGANIPPSLQEFVDHMTPLNDKVQYLRDKLSEPAPKQLLINHISAPNFGPAAERSTWLNDLNALGNYPKKTRNVAIANGTKDATALFTAGSKFLNLKIGTLDPICNPVFMETGLWSTGNNSLYSGTHPLGADLIGMSVSWNACSVTCPICLTQPNNYFDARILGGSNFNKNYDNAPGSKRNTIIAIVKEFRKGLKKQMGDLGYEIGLDVLDLYQPDHTFITTLSALDINSTNLNLNIDNFLNNHPDQPNPGKYPFEAYYSPTATNETHVEFTDANIDWIIKEVVKTENKLSYANGVLNNNSPNNGVYNYARIENRQLRTIVINNMGKLLVNGNISSDFGITTPGPSPYINPPYYPSPIIGSTYTLETCYCNNVVVEVGNNGQFILGDNNNGANNNKAVVLFHDGSQLKITNGGKLTVRKGSQLIIEPNAELLIDNGGQLIVEDGGQVIIQGTINPGGQSGNYGKLTYKQGAQIQLKGDNAVLELDGQLYIDNNAQFTFTYPGTNSGYLKFNRGNVFSDNYAPGNAMISCGTSTAFKLTGQNKNDKLIDIRQIDLHMPDQLGAFTITNGKVEFNEHNAMLSVPVKNVFTNVTLQGDPNLVTSTEPTRGVVIYGTVLQNFNNCDFKNLGTGLNAALFYGGYNLNVLNNCTFTNCQNGAYIQGAGAVVKNTQFTNNTEAFSGYINHNTSMLNCTINSTGTYQYATTGIRLTGSPITLYMEGNSIQHQNVGMSMMSDVESKMKCTGITNNHLAYFGDVASKLNMSTLLGAGYVNAGSNDEFADFEEATYWETEQGNNSFKINDYTPCYNTTGTPGHPAIQHCPTISEGTLLSMVNYNSTTGFYELTGTGNYWRIWNGQSLEYDYNKLSKLDIVNNNPVFTTAHLLDNNPLLLPPFPCINGNGSSFPFGTNQPAFIHPLDNNSPSTSITTASFYNKKLSWALNFSLEKMTDLNDVPKINQAADLLTEVLKYNYPTPVTNYADKYLLELAYQKLFSCVAQLTQIYKPITDSLGAVPANLQPRYGDLMQIIAFRLGRKSINDVDYKQVNDLILLDKALVYRLQEDRPSAIATLSGILAGNPKTQHRNLYEYWRCVFTNEQNAISHVISVPDAMAIIKKCSDDYKAALYSPSNARKATNTVDQQDEVAFSNEYAIAVYPNPATTELNMDYDLKQFQQISLEIFDVQGKLLKSHQLDPMDGNYRITNLDLESGIYFYRITGDNKTLMNKKLVITK